MAATMRSTFSLSAARTRMHAFEAWETGARAAGFPADGPEMVLGVSDQRLIGWRTSFLLGRPIEITASLPIDQIVDVSAVRHGLVTGVAFVFANGSIVEVEALRGRRLRALAREVAAVIADRRRRA
jgi:hypothetical protein